MFMYLCPALMDWLIFFVLFAVFYSAGIHGMGIKECAWLGILFQVAYMLFSLVTGHFLNRRNAKAVLVVGTSLCGLSSVLGLLAHTFGYLSAILLVFGMATAFFFNSFQTFMRGEAAPGELKKSVAFYTLSWSMGAAMGNLTAGFLYEWGIWAMSATVVIVVTIVLALLLRHKPRHFTDISADEHVEQGSSASPPVSHSYVIVGWIMIFTAMFVQRPIFTFLPPIFARDGIGPLPASLPLFLHMAVQALIGFAMWRFRDLLYRRTSLWIIQCLGALAFCAIWQWPNYWVCLPVLMVLGIYAGFVYFCAVYYASNSGRRSFNIGVNEALVGLGSMAGIFIGDWWMRLSHSDAGMYLVCAVGLGVSTLIQIIVASSSRSRQEQVAPSD